MFVIDTQSKLPIFEQLKKQILEFITIGILSPNDKLPSVRAMASQIGVNPNTVAKAYQELEEQGFTHVIFATGGFVADNESDKLIREEKLKDFKGTVLDMKQHHIEKEALYKVVNSVYEEGKDHA